MLVLHSKSKTALAKTQQPMGPVALKAMRWTLTTLSLMVAFLTDCRTQITQGGGESKLSVSRGRAGNQATGGVSPLPQRGGPCGSHVGTSRRCTELAAKGRSCQREMGTGHRNRRPGEQSPEPCSSLCGLRVPGWAYSPAGRSYIGSWALAS